MGLISLLKGFILGVVVAAPVGPVGALVIRRTLKTGPLMGLFTGLGAACADSLFGAIAILGLGTVQASLLGHQRPLALGGGLVILIVGFVSLARNLRDRRASQRDVEAQKDLPGMNRPGALRYARALIGSFLITLTNPVTIVGFGVAFTSLGFAERRNDWTDALALVAVLFLGSLAWWLSLSFGVQRLKRRLGKGWIFSIHISTSLLIVLSGLACVIRGLSLF